MEPAHHRYFVAENSLLISISIALVGTINAQPKGCPASIVQAAQIEVHYAITFRQIAKPSRQASVCVSDGFTDSFKRAAQAHIGHLKSTTVREIDNARHASALSTSRFITLMAQR
ncbi:MAG TPA: hypothetical protein VF636_03525 [Sphingomonas sp.]